MLRCPVAMGKKGTHVLCVCFVFLQGTLTQKKRKGHHCATKHGNLASDKSFPDVEIASCSHSLVAFLCLVDTVHRDCETHDRFPQQMEPAF